MAASTHPTSRGTQFTMYVASDLLKRIYEMQERGQVRIGRVDSTGQPYVQILDIPDTPNQVARLALELLADMVKDQDFSQKEPA